MNYEDRTDLRPPSDLVRSHVLAQLSLAEHQEALADQGLAEDSAVVSPTAQQVICQQVQQDTEQGASPEAAAIGTDAMLCGYRFGRLLLGSADDATVPPDEVLRRVSTMDLYQLPVVGTAPVQGILARHPVQPTAAEEEYAAWAWSFGLGVAAAETDLGRG